MMRLIPGNFFRSSSITELADFSMTHWATDFTNATADGPMRCHTPLRLMVVFLKRPILVASARKVKLLSARQTRSALIKDCGESALSARRRNPEALARALILRDERTKEALPAGGLTEEWGC